jgi:hypothetical protein
MAVESGTIAPLRIGSIIQDSAERHLSKKIFEGGD